MRLKAKQAANGWEAKVGGATERLPTRAPTEVDVVVTIGPGGQLLLSSPTAAGEEWLSCTMDPTQKSGLLQWCAGNLRADHVTLQASRAGLTTITRRSSK